VNGFSRTVLSSIDLESFFDLAMNADAYHAETQIIDDGYYNNILLIGGPGAQ
jgi:hypothetical protein